MTRDRILVVRKLISESLLTVIYMYHTETLLYRSFKKAGQKKTKIWMIVSSLYILLKSLLSYERRMFHTLPKILRQQATKNLFYNFRNYRMSNDTLYKHFICYKYSMNSCWANHNKSESNQKKNLPLKKYPLLYLKRYVSIVRDMYKLKPILKLYKDKWRERIGEWISNILFKCIGAWSKFELKIFKILIFPFWLPFVYF